MLNSALTMDDDALDQEVAPMSWPEELAAKIRAALASGEPHRITVPTQAQAELGRLASERLARAMNADPSLIMFEVVPAEGAADART
jgi:hypothetical protein